MVTPAKKKVRVLITKSEMDAHDAAPKYVSRLLREAGMEVIFTHYRVAEEIVKMSLEEDVDVIGISFYSSGAMYDTAVVMRLLKEKGMDNILVVLGGIFRDEEVPQLLEMGVGRVFRPGDPDEDIAKYIISQKGG